MASSPILERAFDMRLHQYRRDFPGKYQALGLVAKALDGIPHMTVGGTAAFLHGLDLVPKDIDIVTTAEGAQVAHERLKEFAIQPLTFKETEAFSTHLGLFRVNGVLVQVLGDLQVKRSKVEYRVPVTPLALDKATVLEGSGFHVVLAPVEDEVISAAVVEAGKHRNHLPHWLRVHKVDREYLEARMEEMGIPKRLREVVRREVEPT